MKQLLFSISYVPRDGESTLDEIEVFSHLILDDAAGVWQSQLHELESIQ